jgi:hypothetical protein
LGAAFLKGFGATLRATFFLAALTLLLTLRATFLAALRIAFLARFTALRAVFLAFETFLALRAGDFFFFAISTD